LQSGANFVLRHQGRYKQHTLLPHRPPHTHLYALLLGHLLNLTTGDPACQKHLIHIGYTVSMLAEWCQFCAGISRPTQTAPSSLLWHLHRHTNTRMRTAAAQLQNLTTCDSACQKQHTHIGNTENMLPEWCQFCAETSGPIQIAHTPATQAPSHTLIRTAVGASAEPHHR
jgi:hypothetical protein